jgi:hypothetical protein
LEKALKKCLASELYFPIMKTGNLFWFFQILLLCSACKVGLPTKEGAGYLIPLRLSQIEPWLLDSLSGYKVLDYIVDTALIEAYPIKTIRIGFHILNDEKGHNQLPKDQALAYLQKTVENMNVRLESNHKMNLPLSNQTPVLPARWRVRIAQIEGEPFVKFHGDDAHYWGMSSGPHRNNFQLKLFEKYGVYEDSIYNIFIQSHPLDSLKSPTANLKLHGIAFKNHCKLIGVFDPTLKEKGKPYERDNLWPHWEVAKLLQHEMAHSLGLRHAWGNDGCEDTPRHSNCWNRTRDGSICDSLWSNNLMDYNAHQVAMTPCQIGKMRENLIDKQSSMHRFVDNDWCEHSGHPDLLVVENTHWVSDAYLKTNLIVKENITLVISASLSLPHNANIYLEPGAKVYLLRGTLYNACDLPWGGIKALSPSKKNPPTVWACSESTILLSNFSSF